MAINKENDTNPHCSPYRYLYIYLINGLVNADDEMHLGENFLGNWVDDGCSFLFFSRSAIDIVNKLLGLRLDLELIEDHRFTYEQWQGGSFETMQIDNFLISSPWANVDAAEDTKHISLDPGVVFGNGLHPTTRDCVRAIDLAYAYRPFKRVLDLGTGTGILAIAAALMGAKDVMCVDINPLCVKTAINNVRLNGLSEVVNVKKGSSDDYANMQADLVVANIHYEVIKRFLTKRQFNKGDLLILSGLLRSQARDVEAQLKMLGFRIIRKMDYEMTWFTFYIVFSRTL